MKNAIIKIMMMTLFVCGFSLNTQADEDGTGMTAIELKMNLAKQEALLEKIQPTTELVDLARIKYIKKISQKTRELVEQKKTIGNIQVVFAIQELMLSYDYSVSFFNSISNEMIANEIEKLYEIQKKIVSSFDLDKAVALRMIENMMRQIHGLMEQLKPIVDGNLKAKLDSLKPLLGDTIAKASQGDRPRAFTAGTQFYRKLIEVYPSLNEMARQQQAFNLIIEIRSLAEFFREYAQIEASEIKSGDAK